MPQPVLHALGRVAGTDELPARSARPDLVGREDRRRLQVATGPVLSADQAPRRVGAAQMRGAVNLPVHHAHRLMRRADRLAAARALRHFVHAHRLVGPALTVPQARRAQTAAALRRLRVALLRVAVADDPAAAAAGREARRAGRVPVFDADTFVRRAVLQAARRADPRVLLARRLPVHATLRDTVVRAEVLGADRAAVRAGLTAAVLVPANHERRRRAAAMGTGEQPGRHPTERPLRRECRVTPPRRFEPPLGALHQYAGLDELQRMHHGLYLAAPDLFSPAPLGERRDGANALRVALLLEDRLEVAVQAAELGGKLLLRRGAARGDPLGRFFLEVAEQELEQLRGLPGGDRLRRARKR